MQKTVLTHFLIIPPAYSREEKKTAAAAAAGARWFVLPVFCGGFKECGPTGGRPPSNPSYQPLGWSYRYLFIYSFGHQGSMNAFLTTVCFATSSKHVHISLKLHFHYVGCYFHIFILDLHS